MPDPTPIDLSAQTGALSTVHHPLGRPGGPGLFRVENLQLPAYIQNIAAALERAGHQQSQAIQLAIGACQRWASGAGKVSPEVRAAAAKALAEWEKDKAVAHSHASDTAALELAGVFNSALHPRVAAGASNGGQFGSAAASSTKPPAKGAKPAAKAAPKKAPAKPPAKPAHPNLSAKQIAQLKQQKAALHAKAAADIAQANKIDGQVKTLDAAIAKRVASGKATAAAAKKAAASKKVAAVKAKSSTKTTAKKKISVKKTVTVAQMRTTVAGLRVKSAGLRAQAKALNRQAAAIHLTGDPAVTVELAASEAVESANGTEALEMAMMMKTARVRGPGDVSCKRTAPGEVTVTHKPTGMRIGKLTPARHGGWQGTHATGKPSPASGSMAGALSGLIGLHNKVAASMPSAEPAGPVHAMAAHEAAMELAGALPYTSAATSTDGPRVTTMGGAKTAKAAKAKTATVPERVQAIYRKLIAKGMKPAQAMALAKRAASMHAKATAKAA